MAFCFRLRCDLGETSHISSDEARMVLASPDDAGVEVVMVPGDGAGVLRDARRLVIRGRPYESGEQATQAGLQWRRLLEIGFASMRVGVRFGDRAAGAFWTADGLKMIADANGGRPALNDVHGLSVFDDTLAPLFVASGDMSLIKGTHGPAIQRAVREAAARGLGTTPEQQIAYDLYSASFSTRGDADARFVLLAMALETLMHQDERPPASVAVVDHLVTTVEESDLPSSERQSLASSLKWLRRESISASGRKLAATLGERTYMDRSPKQFFTECYELRSRLVHGYAPRPGRFEVDSYAATLEDFVGDLIAAGLVGFNPRLEPDPT